MYVDIEAKMMLTTRVDTIDFMKKRLIAIRTLPFGDGKKSKRC